MVTRRVGHRVRERSSQLRLGGLPRSPSETRDGPKATQRILQRRFRGELFIYLFGDASIISHAVQQKLARYGHVQRVPGGNATEISVNFAGFRNSGFDDGFWLSSWNRDFGWGIAESGHNFIFVNPRNWQQALTGSLLAHMGKHGPILVLAEGAISEPVRRYLERVQPVWATPRDQLINHVWILGGLDSISQKTQIEIDSLLEPQ